jgi:hypothetical protein
MTPIKDGREPAALLFPAGGTAATLAELLAADSVSVSTAAAGFAGRYKWPREMSLDRIMW